MQKTYIGAVLVVFILGGCGTVGKLAQVVGGAYQQGGQVLIDKDKEDKAAAAAEQQQSRPVAVAAADQTQVPGAKPVAKTRSIKVPPAKTPAKKQVNPAAE